MRIILRQQLVIDGHVHETVDLQLDRQADTEEEARQIILADGYAGFAASPRVEADAFIFIDAE